LELQADIYGIDITPAVMNKIRSLEQYEILRQRSGENGD